jgi:hypothetical protein
MVSFTSSFDPTTLSLEESNLMVSSEDFRHLKRSLYPCPGTDSLEVLTFPQCGFQIHERSRDEPRGTPSSYPTPHPEPNRRDRQVTIKYLAYHSHMRWVVCTGGYSILLSNETVLSYSMSYATRDPTLVVTLPLA